jgi:hypothetical protein
MTTSPKPEARPEQDRKSANRKVDEASDQSMDASDPPSFNPGTAGAAEDRRSVRPKTTDRR